MISSSDGLRHGQNQAVVRICLFQVRGCCCRILLNNPVIRIADAVLCRWVVLWSYNAVHVALAAIGSAQPIYSQLSSHRLRRNLNKSEFAGLVEYCRDAE
jgi:hypothetical protein